jgi:hypothetical protein
MKPYAGVTYTRVSNNLPPASRMALVCSPEAARNEAWPLRVGLDFLREDMQAKSEFSGDLPLGGSQQCLHTQPTLACSARS